jgi:hypothetical protein
MIVASSVFPEYNCSAIDVSSIQGTGTLNFFRRDSYRREDSSATHWGTVLLSPILMAALCHPPLESHNMLL